MLSPFFLLLVYWHGVCVSITMRTAFSIWNQRIAPVFDTAHEIHLADYAPGRVEVVSTYKLADTDLAQKINWLLQQGVSTLVCGAVSRVHQEKLVVAGIKVVPFVAGDIGQVMHAYFDGTLKHAVFKMPGCCGQRPQTCPGRCHSKQKKI
jgi:predicted Fe-Mo cluster-binding NifX family protein